MLFTLKPLLLWLLKAKTGDKKATGVVVQVPKGRAQLFCARNIKLVVLEKLCRNGFDFCGGRPCNAVADYYCGARGSGREGGWGLEGRVQRNGQHAGWRCLHVRPRRVLSCHACRQLRASRAPSTTRFRCVHGPFSPSSSCHSAPALTLSTRTSRRRGCEPLVVLWHVQRCASVTTSVRSCTHAGAGRALCAL